MEEKFGKNLKILEPIQLDVKTFQDKQEFELFFNSHRDEFENSTTTKLNRMYKIPGYRITRQKDQLCLKKDYTKKENKESKSEDDSGRYQELFEKISELEEKFENISLPDVSKLETQIKLIQAKIKKM